MVTAPFEASLVTVRVALKLAAEFGLNEMLRFALDPGASKRGSAGAAKAKYFVENEALLMVTDFAPELVALTVRVLLVPGVTSPKSRLAFPRARVPFCSPGPDWLNP